MSSKLILGDHVHNSHDHSVLQSIDITRRNLMLITLRAERVKRGSRQTLPPDKYLVRRVGGVKLCYRLFVLFGPKDHIVYLSLLCSVIIFIHFKALRKRTHCYTVLKQSWPATIFLGGISYCGNIFQRFGKLDCFKNCHAVMIFTNSYCNALPLLPMINQLHFLMSFCDKLFSN